MLVFKEKSNVEKIILKNDILTDHTHTLFPEVATAQRDSYTLFVITSHFVVTEPFYH